MKKLTLRKTWGCFIGFLGILFMNMSGASANFSFIGEGFVFMSQLCGAISAAFIKKFTQKTKCRTIKWIPILFRWCFTNYHWIFDGRTYYI